MSVPKIASGSVEKDRLWRDAEDLASPCLMVSASPLTPSPLRFRRFGIERWGRVVKNRSRFRPVLRLRWLPRTTGWENLRWRFVHQGWTRTARATVLPDNTRHFWESVENLRFSTPCVPVGPQSGVIALSSTADARGSRASRLSPLSFSRWWLPMSPVCFSPVIRSLVHRGRWSSTRHTGWGRVWSPVSSCPMPSL